MAIISATAAMIITVVVTAATTAYQIIQAKKMKKAADRAAEARRGFEVPIDGAASNLPIIYGRAKVGGVRTFHATSSKFTYVTPNADKIFQTGRGAKDGYSIGFSLWSGVTGLDQFLSKLQNSRTTGTLAVSADPGGYLTSSQQAKKNEYLFFQQALCLGPIHAVYDVIIDESRYLDDTALGTYGFRESEDTTGIKAAMRIDCHYLGGTADSIMAANFPEKNTALFTDMAFASAVVRLDRDEPQFNAVPSLQFLIEGRTVRTVNALGQLSSTRVYSNNPAWCLLDYLLDPIAGKGLQTDELDLLSFYNAAQVCATIVQEDVVVGGKFYQPTDGSRNITLRDLPLYECNIIVDPEKPIRENIEAILATMGDARLVWSAGQYRLNLQYPSSNAAITLAEVITDDDLLLEQEIELSWPTGSEKFNYAVVKFHNEMENFKEDSASWPPKINDSYLRGIGAVRYSLPDGDWDASKPGGILLSNYGVWSGDNSSVSLSWLFKVDKGLNGSYTIKYTADNQMTITIYDHVTNTQLYTGSASNWKNEYSGSISLGSATEDKLYRVQITATDTGSGKENYKAVAAKIENSTRLLWTTRSPNYSAFIPIVYNSTTYDTMKAEDSELELEAEIFADGITDYYHALAKAEELVRTSRTALNVKFKYKIKETYLEPGDFVRLESENLNLGLTPDILYLRVNSVKIDADGSCEVQATKFDYTQLAWNVKDNVYYSAFEIVSTKLPTPTELVYSAMPDSYLSPNSGRLDWGAADWPDLAGYVVYKFDPASDSLDTRGQPLFVEIGRTQDQYFIIPQLEAASAIFGVRASTKAGKLSDMTTTGMTQAVTLAHPWLKSVELSASSEGFIKDGPDSIIPANISLTANAYHFTNPTFSWEVDGQSVSGTSNQITLDPFTDKSASLVKVTVKDAGGINSYTATKTISYGEKGQYPVEVYLTRPSLNLYAYSNGVIQNSDAADGFIIVKQGDNILTADATIQMTASGCEVTLNTADNTPVAGKSKGYYVVTSMNNTLSGSIDFAITYNNVTYNLSVSVSKLVVGYQITSGLPDTNLFEGRMIYNNDDNKLYKYENSEWVPVVRAVDLSGQIASGQIAEDAVDSSNLATSLANRINLIDAPSTGLVTQVSGISTRLSNFNNSGVTIEQSATATANSIDDLSGQYTVKIDNNGHVSGFGLASNTVDGTPQSAFIIRADKFAVVDPASTANNLTNTPTADALPFLIDGGVVYLKTAVIKDGSIGNAKIGSLDAAKINSGFISADRIDTGAITAAKLATTELITLSAQIKNGIIETAKIGDLQVSTLKIANNAVTVPASVYTTGNISIPFNTNTVIQNYNFASSGAPVIIVASFTLFASPANALLLTIYRGTTVIYGSSFASAVPLGSQVTVSFLDTPPVGTHNYQITVRNNNSTVTSSANQRSLSLIEAKK